MNVFPQVDLMDGAALLFVLIGAFIGLKRGLTRELAGVFTTVAAAGAALYAYLPLAHFLETHTSFTPGSVRPIALALVLFASFGIILLIRMLVGKLITVSFAEWFDRIGGAVAGFISATVFVLLIFVIANAMPPESWNAGFGDASLIGRTIRKYEAGVVESIDTKVERARGAIQKARETHTGRQEKWE
jgi:uncharacterized membrane protein required for colicin V production